jgi:hypothetical protein
LVDSSKEARAKADLKFRKAEREATVRDLVLAEHAAEAERRKAKSSKLKELRLAKEAADLASGNSAPAKKKPARKTSKG